MRQAAPDFQSSVWRNLEVQRNDIDPVLFPNLDLFGFYLLLFRQSDGQDAILIICANLFFIDNGRDRKCPAEHAVGPLNAMVVFLSRFFLELTLTFESENIVLKIESDILAVDSRQ